MKAKRKRIKNAWCMSELKRKPGCRMKQQKTETERCRAAHTGGFLAVVHWARSSRTNLILTLRRVSSEDTILGTLQQVTYLIK